MRFLILALIFSASAQAEWCDIVDKKSKTVLSTYEGRCQQKMYGGPWGDSRFTEHVVNTTKQKQIDAEKIEREQKEAAQSARLKRISEGCAKIKDEVLLDICNEIVDRAPVARSVK